MIIEKSHEKAKMIYLLLDYSLTVSKIEEFQVAYNAKMKKLHPTGWKKYTLKPSHIGTMKVIAYFYMVHCFNNKQYKRSHDNPFWIRLSQLCKKTGGSKKTMREHLKRLQECQILRKKENYSCKLFINPRFLVPQNLINEIEIISKIKANEKICFSIGSTAFFTVCTCIASCENTHDAKHNTNGKTSESGQPVNNATQNHFGNNLHTGSLNHWKHKEQDEHYSEKKEVAQRKSLDNMADNGIKTMVFLAWLFIYRTLYKNAHLSANQVSQAQNHLVNYFKAAVDKPQYIPHNIPLETRIEKSYLELIERVALKRYQMDNQPECILAPPNVWLNPQMKWGFAWTEQLYEQVLKKRAGRQDYYSNRLLFAKTCKLYSANPTLDEYNKSTLKLKKLRDDGKLLKLFQQFVINPETFKESLKHSITYAD